MNKLMLNQIRYSELNFLESSSGEYTPPTQIVLLPKSPIVGRDGRNFHYNTQEILDSFIENQAELPIDIEHATEIKAPKGEYSGAVGWVKSVQAGTDGEILGNLDWNNYCYELASKTYKYYSPAFEVDDKDPTKAVRLTSVGLTNRPNFKIPALNSRQTNSFNSKNGGKKLNKKLTRVINSKKSRNEEEITEDQLVEEAKDVLDLSADASLNDVIEEIAKLKDEEGDTSINSAGDVPASILSALDLAEGSSLADVVDAIEKLKGSENEEAGDTETNSKSVKALQSEVKKLSNIINTNASRELKEKKDRVLNSAINNGKVSPATRKALEMSLNSVEAVDMFETDMEKAPSVFAPNITKPAGFNNSTTSLNAEQKEWCKSRGIKEADYVKMQSKILGN